MRNALVGGAVAVIGLLALGAGTEAAERRCGWLVNPTPANYYLQDAQASWWLMSQGGLHAEGVDEHLPAFDERQYVQTQPNGYGYGCACLTVDVDAAEQNVTRLYAGKTLPLSKCERDPALPKPE